MDEALELVETVADSEFEGVITWVLRLIGLLAILAGIGLWLVTNMGLLVVPLALMVGGVVLLIVPSILLTLTEFAG